MDEIDRDLLGGGSELRVHSRLPQRGTRRGEGFTPGYDVFAVRKERPGVEVLVKVEGSGGPFRAGLPALLEESLYEFPPKLMRILAEEEPVKIVRRARSRADLLDLLGRKESQVTIKLELSGDVTIDDASLEPYRMRLRTLMEWVRTRFPPVAAEGNIVAVQAG